MASKTTRKRKTTGTTRKKKQNTAEKGLRDEVFILIALAFCTILLISNFGIGGFVGSKISAVLFGIFGSAAYAVPILLFAGTAFLISNRGNVKAYIKSTAVLVFIFMVCTFLQLVTDPYKKGAGTFLSYYHAGSTHDSAGGLIGGGISMLLCPALGVAGAFIVVIVLSIICIVLITEKSVLKGVTQSGKKAYTRTKEHVDSTREIRLKQQEEKKVDRKQKQEERQQKQQEKKEKQRQSGTEKEVVSGVSFDTTLRKNKSPEVRELTPPPEELKIPEPDFVINRAEMPDSLFTEEAPADLQEKKEDIQAKPEEIQTKSAEVEITDVPAAGRKRKSKQDVQAAAEEAESMNQAIRSSIEKPQKDYKFPPLSILTKGQSNSGDSDTHLRKTAMKLQQTLENFGVNVTITNVSCGPSVTRYELQPEQGVKVSKIVGLTDDIKLNLAAADIRIEAPIPGKAAVGIEVPNKENTAVMLRDLLESQEFKSSKSNISFAVGRDIGGKAVVADIKKMPHVLIAGATGSGKSVCINTLIMSILYKADPKDVKLIMIDPKVVELSVYNGIPHLLIPVVTDPKKAAGALNWAVAEMTKRYEAFAQYNVRDLEGYNSKVKNIEQIEEEGKPEKMPQIIIIVDELADLMMVAPGDVEEAICRLAQLARAAGIHLVIATQRPSVNVITGLIKANMPSRIAFSVSSGVDSRTIIDMNGAEKLLGKGDMLFYPSGYQKPVRVQGSFVSDKEVQSVVDYLVDHNENTTYNEDIENHVNTAAVSGSSSGAQSGGGEDSRDVYFTEAGKFIIEKDKASIGMLQRMFKIGFNRAARIMDQLAEAGVVGEEEGTKPRKVLMSMEQFEQYIEEYL